MSWIEDSIDRLLINSEDEYSSRLEQIAIEIDVENTQAKGYCYCIKLDGNDNPRWKDLVEFVADRIVDYAIPKKEIDEAKTSGSTAKILALKRKANELFTDIKTTGEGGEMLLYILTQDILRIPQLISKMSLKTSGNVHYHGVDGIHVKFEESTNSLVLYWGESKMYKVLEEGLKACFESLKGFLLDSFSYTSTQERDLHLITTNLSANVNDPKLEDLLVRYFDKDDDLSNNLKYKGVCFIGFDSACYPTTPLTKKIEALKKEFEVEATDWIKSTKSQIDKIAHLSKYEIHVFLIPFPSVQEFRDYFLELLDKK
jgi:hypothetical protein